MARTLGVNPPTQPPPDVSIEDEMQAMNAIIRALEPLNERTRDRILRYVHDRFAWRAPSVD